MQIGSDHQTPTTGKATKIGQTGKTSRAGKQAKANTKTQTLRLKAKHLDATPVGDVTSLIATAAYYRAEQRGFAPGYELEDWLQAEQQIRQHYQS